MRRSHAASCAISSPADPFPRSLEVIPLPALPRPDQLVDAVRHRALRLLGTDTAPGRAGRAALRGLGGQSGQLRAEHAVLLHQLGQGRAPALGELLAAVSAQLTAADAARERGRESAAARHLDAALRLAFHQSVHYGPDGSPLMLRPEEFLAPLRASAVARAALFDEDAPRPPAPTLPPTSPKRPRRVLVLCASSWTFIDRVVADLREHTDVGLRVVDLSTLPLAERPSHALALRGREQWRRARRLLPVPAALEEDLRWADTVFVEWGSHTFAWLTFLDLAPFDVRVVARIHRYEILTPYPLLARCAALDEIVFVAPTVREMLTSVSPRLAQARALRDLQNVHDLQPFVEAGEASTVRDPFRLLQIGWAPPIKDVEFSLAVIERLREVDPRFTLALVGHGPAADGPEAERARALRERLAALGDGVEELGFRTDVPALLAGAGFLLSSSRAEGTHESVAEAAAAGCVPVVRNWPEMAPWGGASRIFPADWVVEDVEEAVQAVLALADPARREQEAQRRRDLVLAERDPARIRAGYLALLGA